MKFITEESNNQVLEKIRKEGWDNYNGNDIQLDPEIILFFGVNVE